MRHSALMKALLFSLENHDWQDGQYSCTILCKQTRAEIWTGNGAAFCKPYNPEINIGLINSFRLWKAVQRMRARQAVSKIYGAELTESIRRFDEELSK